MRSISALALAMICLGCGSGDSFSAGPVTNYPIDTDAASDSISVEGSNDEVSPAADGGVSDTAVSDVVVVDSVQDTTDAFSGCLLGEEALCPGKSCAHIKHSNVNAQTGTFWIQPNGSVAVTQGYCDMDYKGPNSTPFSNGWTLIFRISPTVSDNDCSSLTSVLATSRGYYPLSFVSALGSVSNTVHIRTSFQQDTRSITSVPNSAPINNLSNGYLLNRNFNISDWAGPMVASIGAAMVNAPQQFWNYKQYPFLWTSNSSDPNNAKLATGGLWLGAYSSGSCIDDWNATHGAISTETIEIYLGNNTPQ